MKTIKLPLSQFAFIWILILFVFPLHAQPFEIGHLSLNFNDPSRNNRSIATEIYYPADVAGDNVPMTAVQSEKFPPLIFGHGFVMGWESYENIWSSVVPQGFIMAFPKTEGGILPSHIEYGRDLAFVAQKMQELGLTASSVFFDRISISDAVMGHSMGGGAAFLAAEINPDIKAIVTLAPAQTNPSAIAAASSLNIPSLIFAGENDCVTPPAANQLAMYNVLQSVCKSYISINGASHCQMANFNLLCSFGEATCSPSPEISREEQHATISNYLINWLKAKLKSDCGAGTQFDSQIISDTDVTYQKNCLLCQELALADSSLNSIAIYPNPFSENILLQGRTDSNKRVVIYDSQFRQMFSADFNLTGSIETETLSSGLYFYTISEANQILKQGKLIKN